MSILSVWAEVKAMLDWRTIQNHKRNVVYFGLNESKTHFMEKASECYRLRQEGYEFITEAIFSNGKDRADILAWNEDGVVAFEIVHTEDEAKSGKEKYPCLVQFVRARNL